MLKISDITSLIFIFFLINLYLEYTLSTQTCFYRYLSAQKYIEVDQIRPKWSKWTELDQIEQSGPNG